MLQYNITLLRIAGHETHINSGPPECKDDVPLSDTKERRETEDKGREHEKR
jgi:hypothetical protein